MIDDLKRSLQLSFETHLLPRYQQLESREQKIVLAAALLLPLIIILFGLILPLQDSQQALQKELSLMQNKAIEADKLASYLTQHAAKLNANSNTENLLTIVERLARQSKVRRFITRIKPQSSPGPSQQRLLLRIKDAPYETVLKFIHALAKRNLGLKSMKIQAAKTPGFVHASAIITGAST
ncbi:MAG: type II secretion system protein M [Mariprofundus sp.]|nr:type II secretion system protein M [Mariprofundus sp.]